MKKFLSLTAAATLSLVFLAGCGKKKNETAEVKKDSLMAAHDDKGSKGTEHNKEESKDKEPKDHGEAAVEKASMTAKDKKVSADKDKKDSKEESKDEKSKEEKAAVDALKDAKSNVEKMTRDLNRKLAMAHVNDAHFT
jgi:Skp family chaperone for outer membrane proteins